MQILVFCCAHADQIKAHLTDSKWLKQKSPRVTTVTSTNCLSLGEAMRSLDQKDIIKSTFILVSGTTQVSSASARKLSCRNGMLGHWSAAILHSVPAAADVHSLGPHAAMCRNFSLFC